MSKVLKTAATVVGVVAFAASVVATGGASLSLAPGVIALASGVATVAGIAATALAAVSSLTSGPPPSATVGGNPTDFKADPFAGLPYAMGRTYIGGNNVYKRAEDAFAGGALNDLLTWVTVLSCAGPVASIDTTYVSKVATGFGGTGAAVGALAGYFWQAQQLGASPESAALAVTAGSSTMPSGWTSAHKLSGLAATMTRARFDSQGKQFTSGEPQQGWVGHWVKVYDPRLDSTYPGGSGPQRAGVESTYTWSENPYLHGLTWVLGRYQNGKRVAGLGFTTANIDVAAFVTGANVADANGWKLGGVVYTRPDTKWNCLKAMLQAGGGEPLTVGATISCKVQTPRVSLATIGAGDIVGKASLAATKSRRDRKNIGFPRYRSEANDWQMVDTDAPVIVSSYVVEDKGERTLEREYSLVQDPTQATQLITYELADSREFGPVVLPLKPLWYYYKPGDCVTLDVPECSGQQMLILQRSLAPDTGIVTMTCQSETSGKHAFALGQTANPPPTASVAAHDPSVAAPASTAWSATGVSFTSTGGSIPALVLTGGVDNPNADAVIFEYRPTGVATWAASSADSPLTTRKEITSVTPGTSYDIAVSYRVRGVIGTRRIYTPVIAGSSAIVWSSITGDGRPEDNATINRPGDEMNRNSSFEVYQDGGFPGWTILSGSAIQSSYAPAAGSGSKSMQLGGNALYVSEPMPCLATEPLWVEYNCLVNAGRNGLQPGTPMHLYLSAKFNATGGVLTGSDITIPIYDANVTQGGGVISGVVKIAAPAGVNTVVLEGECDFNVPSSLASMWVGHLRIRRTQPGADVTGQNTANDTLNIAGNNAAAFAAAAAQASLNAAAAISALNIIASDGYLSRGEKPAVILDQQDLNNSYSDIAAKASALGITTELSRLTAAISALNAYLAGLSPAWDDATRDTPINAATFKGDFAEAYAARIALLTKMAATPGAQGPAGAIGPAAPAFTQVGTGTTSGASVFLASGASISFDVAVNAGAGGPGGGSCVTQVQASITGANSWTPFGTVNSPNIATEPIDNEINPATFTNSTGVDRSFDFRVVSTGFTGRTLIPDQSYMRGV